MKKDIIKNELSELKKHTSEAKEIYTDKFLEKSLLLKMEAKKISNSNSQYNKPKFHVNISVTNTFSKKSKKYRILMLRIKSNKNIQIKKYDYDLLNKFLNLILYKNEIALILFLFRHIKRIKRIPNKDYSLHYFIIFFAIMMVLAIIAAIFTTKARIVYFNRV